jgi:hypothetical protein
MMLIVAVCLSTPMINKYFQDIDSSAASIGGQDQSPKDNEKGQPNSMPQEYPAN